MRLFPFYIRRHYAKSQYVAWPASCPECGYAVFYTAIKTRSFIHIFWLPLIPLPATYVLYCPECSHNLEILRREFKGAKALDSDYVAFRRGDISASEYADKLDRWHDNINVLLPKRLVPAEAEEEMPEEPRQPDDRAFY